MEDFRNKSRDLKFCIRETVKMAEQLFYSQTVINRIRNAKSQSEVYRIMNTARKEEFQDE